VTKGEASAVANPVRPRGSNRSRWWQGFVTFIAALVPVSALADLKLCNTTSSRIGVALGYQDKSGWSTEGWWNIAPQSCETLLKGGVPSRFIYVHAIDYDRGGEWAGTNYMCTQDKTFAIRGVQDCQKRGYRRSGFFEVDTGESRDWTIRLSDPDEAPKPRQ
jgi:uncharacterized membrane protein